MEPVKKSRDRFWNISMKPTEEWRKLIFDLNDQAFFDLVRNYLGDIHTPFNKHNLLDQLEHFLLKKENVDQIFSMIDSSDAALLSAIDFLGAVSIERLYELFSGEMPYYSFYTNLLNLEERMLICPAHTGKGVQTVVISPLFRDELEKRVVDIDLFLGCRKAQVKKSSVFCWHDIPVIAAFCSQLLTKKGRNLPLENEDILKDVLIKQSLAHQTGRHLVPVMDNFKELFSMEEGEVGRFFIHAYLSSDPIEVYLYENMRDDRSYPDNAFRRLVLCTAYLAGLEPGDIQRHKENFLRAGLVVESGTGLRKVTSASFGSEGKIVVQPDFSLYIQGSLTFREYMTLAFYAEIRKLDMISRYEITRESFMRGARSGIGVSSFIKLLEIKSGSPLPQNILFSLKSWEEECHGIAVYRGCVVQVDKRFSKLLESNASFGKYVREKLAVGLYLISEEDFPAAIKVVEDVSGQSLELPWENKVDSLPYPALDDSVSSRFTSYDKPASRNRKRTVSGKFLKKIESMDIAKEQKDILADRVRRKLILSEEQLEEKGIRFEPVEARGIDYTRKVRLCQHVLEVGGSFLELELGNEESLLINPVQMKKAGNDILVIGDEIPEGTRVQIPLRKVRLVRKVRTSLMG